KRRGCLTVPRLTLMSLIKMMLVMVSVAAISKTFGLLGFLLRLSFLAKRLHFHAVHFMRTLPTGSVDPNFGRRVRNRRQLNSLQNTWPYGYSMPIAVRYTQDAFSRSGWLWPVDAKGEPLKATSYMAVGFYVA